MGDTIMKALTKQQKTDKDALVTRLRAGKEKLDAAIASFNAARAAEWAKVEAALTSFNEAVVAAGEMRDEVVGAIDDYMGERSEKWQDSEVAERYVEWQSQWEELHCEEVELDEPEDLDLPNGDLTIDELEQVATELP